MEIVLRKAAVSQQNLEQSRIAMLDRLRAFSALCKVFENYLHTGYLPDRIPRSCLPNPTDPPRPIGREMYYPELSKKAAGTPWDEIMPFDTAGVKDVFRELSRDDRWKRREHAHQPVGVQRQIALVDATKFQLHHSEYVGDPTRWKSDQFGPRRRVSLSAQDTRQITEAFLEDAVNEHARAWSLLKPVNGEMVPETPEKYYAVLKYGRATLKLAMPGNPVLTKEERQDLMKEKAQAETIVDPTSIFGHSCESRRDQFESNILNLIENLSDIPAFLEVQRALFKTSRSVFELTALMYRLQRSDIGTAYHTTGTIGGFAQQLTAAMKWISEQTGGKYAHRFLSLDCVRREMRDPLVTTSQIEEIHSLTALSCSSTMMYRWPTANGVRISMLGTLCSWGQIMEEFSGFHCNERDSLTLIQAYRRVSPAGLEELGHARPALKSVVQIVREYGANCIQNRRDRDTAKDRIASEAFAHALKNYLVEELHLATPDLQPVIKEAIVLSSYYWAPHPELHSVLVSEVNSGRLNSAAVAFRQISGRFAFWPDRELAIALARRWSESNTSQSTKTQHHGVETAHTLLGIASSTSIYIKSPKSFGQKLCLILVGTGGIPEDCEMAISKFSDHPAGYLRNYQSRLADYISTARGIDCNHPLFALAVSGSVRLEELFKLPPPKDSQFLSRVAKVTPELPWSNNDLAPLQSLIAHEETYLSDISTLGDLFPHWQLRHGWNADPFVTLVKRCCGDDKSIFGTYCELLSKKRPETNRLILGLFRSMYGSKEYCQSSVSENLRDPQFLKFRKEFLRPTKGPEGRKWFGYYLLKSLGAEGVRSDCLGTLLELPRESKRWLGLIPLLRHDVAYPLRFVITLKKYIERETLSAEYFDKLSQWIPPSGRVGVVPAMQVVTKALAGEGWNRALNADSLVDLDGPSNLQRLKRVIENVYSNDIFKAIFNAGSPVTSRDPAAFSFIVLGAYILHDLSFDNGRNFVKTVQKHPRELAQTLIPALCTAIAKELPKNNGRDSLSKISELPTPFVQGIVTELERQGKLLVILDLIDSLPESVFTSIEREHGFLRYREGCSVRGAKSYKHFLALWREHRHAEIEEFFEDLTTMARAALSSAGPDKNITQSPFYTEVICHAYGIEVPKDGGRGALPNFPSHADRLKRYRFDPEYRLDLVSSVPMILKPGKVDPVPLAQQLEAPLASTISGNPDNLNRDQLERGFHDKLKQVEVLTQIPGDERDGSYEKRVVRALLEGCISNVATSELRALLIAWHYFSSAEARQQAQFSRGQTERSQSPEYTYLLALRELYADNIPESLRSAWERAVKDPAIAETVVRWRRFAAQQENKVARPEQAKRKLGLTAELRSFIDRSIAAVPEDQARQLKERILSAERRRCAAAIYGAHRIRVAPESIKLEEFNLASYGSPVEIPAPSAIDAKDILERGWKGIATILATPLVRIADQALGAFAPADDKIRSPRVIKAVFALHSASAFARGCGGICVADDSAVEGDKERAGKNQWDQEEYLQLMYVDPASYRCVGVCLLHDYRVDGTRYLCASFNPSSTFLYQVDEPRLFEETMRVLISFAESNHFDAIACATQTTVRTNRTGGAFEAALKARVATVNQRVTFDVPRIFSFKPAYKLEQMDILWLKALEK